MLQEDDRPLELESEPTSLLRPRKLLLLSPSERPSAACIATTAVACCLLVVLVPHLLPEEDRALTCLQGRWPSFATPSALRSDPQWAQYITRVYGAVPEDSSAYPYCMGDHWLFYSDVLSNARLTARIPESVGDCPSSVHASAEGELYSENSVLAPMGTVWSWHPAVDEAYAPFAPDTWVEVLHQGGIDDEHVGAWFLHARGSGIWVHTGRTIAFGDHAEAWEAFGVGHLDLKARNEAMCANASAAGLDSLQFIGHSCKMMYGLCLNGSRAPTLYNIEIVSTALVGVYPCASDDGRSTRVRTGWRGANTCTCNNSASSFLHCQEVEPSTRAVFDPRRRAFQNEMMARMSARMTGAGEGRNGSIT